MQAPPTRYTYSYHDIVLALIPLAFISAGLIGWFASLPLEVIFPIAGALSMVIMAHAMFWRDVTPTPTPEDVELPPQQGVRPPDGPVV